jgi:hypothetical protein
MPRTPRTVQSEALLEAALEGLELRRQRLEEEIQHVRSLLGRRAGGRSSRSNHDAVAAAPAARKRRLNPEARKRIAAAQKKRWEEYRRQQAAAKRHSPARSKQAPKTQAPT